MARTVWTKAKKRAEAGNCPVIVSFGGSVLPQVGTAGFRADAIRCRPRRVLRAILRGADLSVRVLHTWIRGKS